VRHWPESSRRWGQAMLAEMEEISEPAALVHWVTGGMLLFVRAIAGQLLEWMKLPAGRGFSGAALTSGPNDPQFPKHSRLATALILSAAVILLFSPIGREATGTMKACWSGFVPSQSDRRDLEKIAAKAEAEKDARGLAFVALNHPDRKRAFAFANQAVAFDPSLVWVYGSRYQEFGDLSANADPWTKLKASDPDNAFVYMASAYAEAGSGVVEQATMAETLRNNKAWMNDMAQAFRAPKFDSYSKRHEELAKEFWTKSPNISPGLLAIALWRHSLWNPRQTLAYAELRVSEALQTGATGHVREAERALHEITRAGQQIADRGTPPFEQAVGEGVIKCGLDGLRRLYHASGQLDEEKKAEAQLQEMEATANDRMHSYVGWREGIRQGLRSRAILLHVSAALAFGLALSIAVSLAWLEMGAAFRWMARGVGRWVACRIADWGPMLFLGACGVMLGAFLPIRDLFERYRLTDQDNREGPRLYWQWFVLSDANPMQYFYSPDHQWLIGTIALAAVAVIVFVRGLMRHKAVRAATP
jgi:hypothetical protein